MHMQGTNAAKQCRQHHGLLDYIKHGGSQQNDNGSKTHKVPNEPVLAVQ
jgi:hypothetical protein